jgi:hypothetical protein
VLAMHSPIELAQTPSDTSSGPIRWQPKIRSFSPCGYNRRYGAGAVCTQIVIHPRYSIAVRFSL